MGTLEVPGISRAQGDGRYSGARSAVQAQQWRTTSDQANLLASVTPAPFSRITGEVIGPSPIVVNPDAVHQEIHGFGAALTDSTAYVLTNYLSQSERDSILRELFAPDQGNMSVVRLGMGGTDFNPVPMWSLDDTVPFTPVTTVALDVGATSLTATMPVTPGATVVLDTGDSQEVFTAGAVTGSATPFTINVASGPLTKAHSSGARFNVLDWYTGALTAAASLGAGTVSASVPMPVGTTMLVDSGSSAEFAVVTALSGSSPFTLTLSEGLNKAHTSGATVSAMPGFAMTREPGTTIPIAQQILAINPGTRFLLTPWSMPAWMKTSLFLGNGQLNTAFVNAAAQYIVQSILAYQAAGIPIHMITPQNEPFDSTGSLTYFTDANYATYVAAVRTALDEAGLETKLLVGDHHWTYLPNVQAVLSNSSVLPGVDGVAWHAYGGSTSVMSTIHRQYRSLEQHMTELRSLYNQDWPTVFKIMTGDLYISAIRNWCNSITLWNLALDQNGNPTPGTLGRRGVIAVHNDASGVTRNPEYYCLMHVSKFVKPGARRIESTTYGNPLSGYVSGRNAVGVQSVAFSNLDGSIVLCCYNSSGASATFPIVDARTEESFSVTMAANEISTFVWGVTTGSPAIVTNPYTPRSEPAPSNPVTLLGPATHSHVGNSVSNVMSFTYTVPSGPNRILVVDLSTGAYNYGETNVFSVTANGVPLRFLARANSGGNPQSPSGSQREIERWYLVAPQAGTTTIRAKFTFPSSFVASAYTLGNAHQYRPFGKTTMYAGSSGGSASVATVGGTSTDLVLSAVSYRAGTPAVQSNDETLVDVDGAGATWLAVAAQPGGTGTVSSGFTFTTIAGASDTALLATAVKAAT